ncbi:hypothetical protein DPEC_G00001760 [Dallia pectoralis]|uniref:Uncharacterized protein n=1 Tax=Dallia pectoralis TaxID=75939 RepID=A0ACC2HJW2_DALPE|nr:hypothetical protein DPEC_G00001760 [Dallia pectoralis]
MRNTNEWKEKPGFDTLEGEKPEPLIMCDGGGLQAVPLHQRPDLLETCADLVNSEWPRSHGARVHSLQKSCQEFPVVLLLLHGSGNEDCVDETLLGHVRLSRVVSHPGSLFVESVVISKTQRGKGYGRTLMQEAERYARARGFSSLCLTTHDKQHFYAHLGYVLSSPVQNSGIMSSFVPMEVLERFSRLAGTDDTLGECPAWLVVQTLEKTPYRDPKGVPIFWMQKTF